MLTNPVYAGAYVFGRTGSRTTIEAGRKRIVRGFRKERAAWEVLILDHHEGYIGWTDFERNQRLISDNANGKSFMSRGSVRRGQALLAGLLRSASCMSRIAVRTAMLDAITAAVAILIMAVIAAFPLAVCASIAPLAPR
jgi:ABC-type phosphate/phosphonate transport system permease subunit